MCGVFEIIREQARSHIRLSSNVGAGLLAKASSQTPIHLGFFAIRNDLALASTIKYITNVINNGKIK